MTELGGVGVTPRTGHGIARWHDRTIDLGEPPASETVDPGDEPEAILDRLERISSTATEIIDAVDDVGADE